MNGLGRMCHDLLHFRVVDIRLIIRIYIMVTQKNHKAPQNTQITQIFNRKPRRRGHNNRLRLCLGMMKPEC